MNRQRTKAERLQAQCDSWNEKHAIGTKVLLLKDGGEKVKTVTRSEAQVLSGHTAVIWLEGISGCYMLDRCTAIADKADGKVGE